MKPKEWLFANGHITEIKQGRISLSNKALIEEAVRNGAKIEGYSVSDTPATGKDEVKVEKTDPNRIYDIPEYPLRDEREWEAYANVAGKLKDIGMRSVEQTCGNSLTYCGCPNPTVRHLDSDTPVLVNFKARVKALPNKRW